MYKERRFEFLGSGIQALGWGLYYILLSIFIIPTAWGAASLYRWMMKNIKISDGTNLTFEGKGAEVWVYYALSMFVSILPQILARIINDQNITAIILYGFMFLSIPLTAYIGLQILDWMISSIKFHDGTTLEFTGKYLPYLGWILLISISTFTIIGWAWASVAFYRWICQKIESNNSRFEFRGSGWGLLWRTFVAGLASLLIIPIPWVYLWVFKWMLSNLVNIQVTDTPEEKTKEENVFFCFAEDDAGRAEVVLACWQAETNHATGFINKSEFSQLLNLGEIEMKSWIDEHLNNSSVTVVLVGEKTCADKRVAYAIEQSIKAGKSLLGIDVSKIKDLHGNKTERCAKIPVGYPFYLWNKDDGKMNLGTWISKAAKEVAN